MKTTQMMFEGKFVEDKQNHTLKMELDPEDDEDAIKQGEKYLIRLKRKIGFAEVKEEYVFVKRLRKKGDSYEFSVPRSEKDKIMKSEAYMAEIIGPVKYYDTGWNRVLIRL